MNYLATAIRANQLLNLDENFNIVGITAINHVRGLLDHNGDLYAAGWDDFYRLFKRNETQYQAFRIGEGGVNNHDLFIDSETNSVWFVNLTKQGLCELNGNKFKACPVDNGFFNTALSKDTWTSLTLKTQNQTHRSYSADRVCIDGKIQKTKVDKPHHLASIRDDWFVCNSGKGQIIEATTGEVILENVGFARGLSAISDDEMVFTSTPLRGTTQKYPKIIQFNPYTRTITYQKEFINYLDFYQITPINE